MSLSPTQRKAEIATKIAQFVREHGPLFVEPHLRGSLPAQALACEPRDILLAPYLPADVQQEVRRLVGELGTLLKIRTQAT